MDHCILTPERISVKPHQHTTLVIYCYLGQNICKTKYKWIYFTW